ncbi:ESX secretion-associated protein EspG [Nocardia flavorosea]|uniref:ESX secretion-associated protein EspG n=1 Tax=Nocardia flavorosea TaxID=53429 RepID=A0A846YFN6_9NOCA|nr:ESX secretion-associated protein EspG [Nocardia flavorosea]NKY56540.1 ESX secretion-associated protein EspG [Nocardia flavorosea]
MKWIFTPDEFSYVWAAETSLDRRPYPVNLAPASAVRTESELAALRLPQRFARQADPDLAAALMLCARPDATAVTISGERSVLPRNGESPGTEQILGFAAVIGHHAAVLHATSTRVTVQMCHAHDLGDRLVALIGSARRGTHGPLCEPQEAVLTDAPIPGCRAAGDAALFRKTLREPVDSRGFLTVTVAPDDPMSPPTRHRSWLDIRGDGRYLLTTADVLVLDPVGDIEFAGKLLGLAGVRTRSPRL